MIPWNRDIFWDDYHTVKISYRYNPNPVWNKCYKSNQQLIYHKPTMHVHLGLLMAPDLQSFWDVCNMQITKIKPTNTDEYA